MLVYTVDESEPLKRERAIAAIESLGDRFMVSAQVLGEFFVNITRKLAIPVPPDEAARRTRRLSLQGCVAVDATLVRLALETSQRSQVSYWDALIVEAAVAGGCDRILSEDLSAGQVIRGVEIVNPFA